MNTARIGERAAIVACGLVPLMGLIFLGWSIVTVIYLLWLDAMLASMRMIPANAVYLKHNQRDRPQRSSRIDWIFLLASGTFMWFFLSIPVQAAGAYMDRMVTQYHPGGFGAQFHDLLSIAPWSFAVFVISRLYQAVGDFAAARASAPIGLVKAIKPLYTLLLWKGAVLFFLSGFLSWVTFFTPKGLELFAGCAIVALIGVELYAERWIQPKAEDTIRRTLEVVHGFDPGRHD